MNFKEIPGTGEEGQAEMLTAVLAHGQTLVPALLVGSSAIDLITIFGNVGARQQADSTIDRHGELQLQGRVRRGTHLRYRRLSILWRAILIVCSIALCGYVEEKRREAGREVTSRKEMMAMAVWQCFVCSVLYSVCARALFCCVWMMSLVSLLSLIQQGTIILLLFPISQVRHFFLLPSSCGMSRSTRRSRFVRRAAALILKWILQ